MVMYSRHGSSGDIDVGLRSNADPDAAGAHRFFCRPKAVLPADACTISIATRRTLFGAANARAGAMASRNGNAMAAPMPFSIVRRSRFLFVMKFMGYLSAAVLTGAATRPIVNKGLVATPWTNAEIFRPFFS